MKIPFHNKKPTEPGQYLCYGMFGIELITIQLIPEQYHGGLKFDAYLGVIEYGEKPIETLNGKFSEKIEAYID